MSDSHSSSIHPKPVLWKNWITLFGLLMVAAGIFMMLTFWLYDLLFSAVEENPYVGLIGYMILPGVLVNGLVICPIGMWLRKRRLKHHPEIKAISTRKAFIFLGVTFFLIMPIMGVAAYKGYHFTESAEFCGTICHNMDPQYVRYQQSPHAHATCAGCHIGPGASPFVKSKLSGMRQVFKTILNTYERPIPPAISELRPARDTCEECHWPNQFFGEKLKKIPHYAPDEKNTLNTYEVLIKVGGLNNHLGQAEGIHMHMLDHVEYVSDDKRLDNIPWVRYTYPDGKKVVYRSDGKPASEPPPHGHVRKLDCIDCHNLVGHDFLSPERAVNHALSVGRLDQSLPYIKREAVRALSHEYKTREEAMAGIEKHLLEFYKEKYPDVIASRAKVVEKAVEAVREIHKAQIFPDMKLDWRTYPNHVGHMESPGCFRCHDGLHVSDNGKRISGDCNSCHTFLYRNPESPDIIRQKKFDHPNKINEMWAGLGPHDKMLCTDCHDGGLGTLGWREVDPRYKCGSCHPSGRWLEIRDRIRSREIQAGPAATRPVVPRILH